MVVALAEISERVNPLLSGILSGLPLGIGITVYFISLEKGISFVIKGIPWGIAGLAATIILCVAYLWVSLKIRNRLLSIILASVSGIALFLLAGVFLAKLRLNLLISLAIFLVVFFCGIVFVNRLAINERNFAQTKNNLRKMALRGVLAGAIIILITGSASLIGNKWSGVLSAFPSTLYPLVLILHVEKGIKTFPIIIKGFLYSVTTLAVFYLACLTR